MASRQTLATLLICLLGAPHVVWPADQPFAALGRVAAVGEIGEAERSIIRGRLETVLSRNYALISATEYDRAEREAFEALDAETCTEQNCIRRIQEALQVERLFIAQVVREGTFRQLSLTLFLGDARRVESADCTSCDIGALSDMVEGLALRLIAADQQGLGVESAAKTESAGRPVPGAPAWALWAGGLSLIGGGVLIASGWAQARDAEQQADKARTDNDPDRYSAAKRDAQTAEETWLAGVVVGGLGAVLLGYYFLSDAANEPTSLKSGAVGRWQMDANHRGIWVGYALRW